MWRRVRQVWITLGLGLTAAFTLWSLLAYRATGEAHAALVPDAAVGVVDTGELIRFTPTGPATSGSAALLFFPGALVDPVAYAPLARAAAEAGFVACIVRLPRRGAFRGAETAELRARVDSILGREAANRRWVIAGHSLGGVVASNVAVRHPDRIAGLVLVGTSHPRDVDLSRLAVPVAKVVGTRDGLASPGEVKASADLVPATTNWVWIEGGNHSQFGSYGFQPADRRATIPRREQQEATVRALIAMLREASSGS